MLFLIPLLASCIGRATPPEQVKLTQQQNEVLGKFARQVGADEVNILLKDPNDATLPGIPVGDLLYILTYVNEDKLIRLVKGVTATSTLELILAIKRVGCTRVNNNPVVAQHQFNATIALNATNGLNSCTWKEFHLPNIMVQLLNGTTDQGLQVLIDTVRHNYPELGLPVNQPLLVTCAIGTCPILHAAPYTNPVSHHAYLAKLAFVAAGFDYANLSSDPTFSAQDLPGPKKLYGLMNLTAVGRDMVFLLDSFDKNTCPVAQSLTSNCVYVDTSNVLTTYDASGNLWEDIQNGFQFQRLRNLLKIIDLVEDTNKMGILLNGRRTSPYSTTQDERQIRYYTDRLKVVLEHTAPVAVTCPAGGPWASFPASTSQAECDLQNYTAPQGPTHTLPTDPGDDDEWNRKLAAIINRIPLANMDRMMDLVYNIEDGYDLNHTTLLPNFPAFPNRGIDNLMVLLNNINRHATHNFGAAVCNVVPDTGAATDAPCNTELLTAAYLINNVTLYPTDADPRRRNKVKYLVEFMGSTRDVLQLACYTAVADHLDGVAPTDVTPDKCDGFGLVNQVADGSKFNGAVTDLTAAGQKLANLADQINEIEDMRFLVKKVSMSNMTQIINGLAITSTINVANLVNQVQGDDCWNENNGVLARPAFNTGLGYTASVANPGAGYTGNFTINPLPGGGNNALVKGIVETDTVNHPAFVGRVRAFVVIDSGNGYNATGTYTHGGGAQFAYRFGACRFNPTTSYRGFPTTSWTGATGLGKLVNVINHITGSPGTIVTLINGVTDGDKLGILINGINRSSNLVGVVNATVDASRNNNATINDLISLMNTISREDVYKLVYMLENFGDAREIDNTITVPSGDHDMVAQLFATYNQANIATTSGLGSAAMADLIGNIRFTGGGGYTSGATMTILGGGFSTAATADLVTTSAGTVSGVDVNTRGVGCTSAPTVNFTGGGGSGAAATAFIDSAAQQLVRVSVTSAGTGYTAAPTVTFTGGGCTTAPTGTAFINRIGSATITNPGAGYTGNPATCTAGGTAVLSCTASGALNTTAALSLTNLYGGTGFVTGQFCPITGAGGSGATCQVVQTGGVLTGCSSIGGGGGANYGSGKIVKIGGRAEAAVTVTGGVVTAISVTNTGCGYLGVPTIEVLGCTVAPTFNVTIPGGVVNATVNTGGSGCPVGAKVVIGENPFVGFSDGASAVVGAITGGTLTSITVSAPAVNAAQLIQLVDRDATGLTSGTRGFAISYNGSSPTLSAREALVRLIHHGVTPSLTSAKAVFNGTGGIGPGTLSMDWPGLGTRYLAGSILNNLSGVGSTQTLINMVNANSIDLVDTVILLGCGDHSTYTNGWVTNSWQQLCTAVGPGIW
ncbi:MAG: hypothetical protein J0L53_08045 [Spirochaetes bacterium]|nr:hypothetical protein [Spirochaetota bacterium]